MTAEEFLVEKYKELEETKNYLEQENKKLEKTLADFEKIFSIIKKHSSIDTLRISVYVPTFANDKQEFEILKEYLFGETNDEKDDGEK